MRKKIDVVILGVIEENKRYLLTKRIDDSSGKYDGLWQIPGGSLEFGESPEQTLKRELKEELGIDVRINKMIPKIFSAVRENWQGILVCFLCSRKDKDKPIVLNEEASKYGWFGIKDLDKLRLLPFSKQIIQEADKYL